MQALWATFLRKHNSFRKGTFYIASAEGCCIFPGKEISRTPEHVQVSAPHPHAVPSQNGLVNIIIMTQIRAHLKEG